MVINITISLLISIFSFLSASANEVILKTGIDEVVALFQAEGWWLVGKIAKRSSVVSAENYVDRDYDSLAKSIAGYASAAENSLDYGTSIMSRQGISQSRSVSFDKPFLRQPKGFVVTTIDWPSAGDVKVDVVSLHLDFLTEAKRRAEIEQLVQALASQTQSRLAKGQQPNLCILMGDFNIDYGDDDALIYELTEKLQLHTYRPMEQLITFPRFERRLDWVLVSRDLEFVEHRVLADPLSDHQAVVADLVMKNPPVPALVSSVELGD